MGATTLSIKAYSIKTFSIETFSIETLSIKAYSIMSLSIHNTHHKWQTEALKINKNGKRYTKAPSYFA